MSETPRQRELQGLDEDVWPVAFIWIHATGYGTDWSCNLPSIILVIRRGVFVPSGLFLPIFFLFPPTMEDHSELSDPLSFPRDVRSEPVNPSLPKVDLVLLVK